MSQQIVVGVDGSQAAEKALIWAAETASRTGAHLVIVHGGDPAAHEGTAHASALDHHRELLRDAVATAIEVSGVCNISTVLSDKHPGQQLLELSESAGCVVVGIRGAGAVASTVLGSVAHRVAAHGRCPVVLVPEEWRPPSVETARPVSVGVSPSEAGRQALEFAFGDAESRRVPLVTVRVWAEFDWTTATANFMTAGHDGVRHREQEQLTEVIEDAWRRHPTVQVDSELASETMYRALLSAARRSDLLVLGCRNDDHLFPRIGATASRLLHTSPCPVAIVGQPAALASNRPGGADGTVLAEQP